MFNFMGLENTIVLCVWEVRRPKYWQTEEMTTTVINSLIDVNDNKRRGPRYQRVLELK